MAHLFNKPFLGFYSREVLSFSESAAARVSPIDAPTLANKQTNRSAPSVSARCLGRKSHRVRVECKLRRRRGQRRSRRLGHADARAAATRYARSRSGTLYTDSAVGYKRKINDALQS